MPDKTVLFEDNSLVFYPYSFFVIRFSLLLDNRALERRPAKILYEFGLHNEPARSVADEGKWITRDHVIVGVSVGAITHTSSGSTICVFVTR